MCSFLCNGYDNPYVFMQTYACLSVMDTTNLMFFLDVCSFERIGYDIYYVILHVCSFECTGYDIPYVFFLHVCSFERFGYDIHYVFLHVYAHLSVPDTIYLMFLFTRMFV